MCCLMVTITFLRHVTRLPLVFALFVLGLTGYEPGLVAGRHAPLAAGSRNLSCFVTTAKCDGAGLATPGDGPGVLNTDLSEIITVISCCMSDQLMEWA